MAESHLASPAKGVSLMPRLAVVFLTWPGSLFPLGAASDELSGLRSALSDAPIIRGMEHQQGESVRLSPDEAPAPNSLKSTPARAIMFGLLMSEFDAQSATWQGYARSPSDENEIYKDQKNRRLRLEASIKRSRLLGRLSQSRCFNLTCSGCSR